MELAVDGLEPAEGQMRVDLGCGDVGVAEQGLHTAQIRAMLAGGLLLDARAALVLFERGFGDQIGLTHERVRKIEQNALASLRLKLKEILQSALDLEAA